MIPVILESPGYVAPSLALFSARLIALYFQCTVDGILVLVCTAGEHLVVGRPCGTKNHLDDGPAFALLWPCQHTYLPVLLTDEHLSVVCTVITFVFITKQGATVSKILLARVYLYLTKVSDAHLIIDDGSATTAQ